MHKTKILIVEDETIVALDIENMLENMDYIVIGNVDNYDDAIKSVNENLPDIVLMDINLENSKNGIETAKSIQEVNDIGIIYLTAFVDEETIEKALETNPIGYIAKPFKEADIKASIKLGLQKRKLLNQKKMNFNYGFVKLNEDFNYDIKNGNLYFQDIPIKLSIKEKALLNIIIEARGNIVSFQDLEYNIWPNKTIGESTLRTLISRLRSKLEYKIIETIPGFGSRIN